MVPGSRSPRWFWGGVFLAVVSGKVLGMAAKSSTSKSGSGFPPWHRAKPAPVVLLLGKQRVFADRALHSLRQAVLSQANPADPPEVSELDPAHYAKGYLAQLLSPSLFGGAPVVVARGLENAPAELLEDLVSYVSALSQSSAGAEAFLFLTHAGGVKGKKLQDLCKGGAGGQAAVFSCDELRWPEEKQRFIISEAQATGRGIEPAAASALVDALGEEFEELLAVADQLLTTAGDLSKPLTAAEVDSYLRGRIEATGFQVADAAVVGDVTAALSSLRHALATGVPAVLIVAAMATKLRQMLKLSAPVPSAVLDTGWLEKSDLNAPPPRVAKQAQAALQRWDSQRLGQAVRATAQADLQVKGGSRDAAYALEAMVLQVCRLASGRSR